MIGKLLFSLQVLAMTLCFFPISLSFPSSLTLLFLALAAGLALWVLIHNKLGNWSVLPLPKEGAQLITSGPYHFMRHPMYSSVIIATLAAIIHNQTLFAFFSWISLLIILNIKARYEERLLLMSFDRYQVYLNTVKTRFLPSLF